MGPQQSDPIDLTPTHRRPYTPAGPRDVRRPVGNRAPGVGHPDGRE